jgi:hypothetical protein
MASQPYRCYMEGIIVVGLEDVYADYVSPIVPTIHQWKRFKDGTNCLFHPQMVKINC